MGPAKRLGLPGTSQARPSGPSRTGGTAQGRGGASGRVVVVGWRSPRSGVTLQRLTLQSPPQRLALQRVTLNLQRLALQTDSVK